MNSTQTNGPNPSETPCPDWCKLWPGHGVRVGQESREHLRPVGRYLTSICEMVTVELAALETEPGRVGAPYVVILNHRSLEQLSVRDLRALSGLFAEAAAQLDDLSRSSRRWLSIVREGIGER